MPSIKENHRQWLRDFYRKASDLITTSRHNSLYGITTVDFKTGLSGVVSTGYNDHEKLNVSQWKDIVKIVTSSIGAVGLTSRGYVVSAGGTYYDTSKERSDLDFGNMNGIKDIAKGKYHTAALLDNGKVISIGSNLYNVCDTSHFQSIVQVVAGVGFVAGLRSDGKVDFAGIDANYLQNHPYDRASLDNDISFFYDTSSWTDVIKLFTDEDWILRERIYGLRKDGTVLVTGNIEEHHKLLSDWSDIVDIIAYGGRVIGIKIDGTIVATYTPEEIDFYSEVSQLSQRSSDIVYAIPEGRSDCVFLRSNGTVFSIGLDPEINKILCSWKNIVAIERINKDLIIGVKSNGNVVQSSFETMSQFNDTQHTIDLMCGIKKDYDAYEEPYTINTSSWHLKALNLDAYVLAVRMMLEGDAETPRGLLETIDYFFNTKDLMKCLDNIDDKAAVYDCVLSGVKFMHDVYALKDAEKYKANTHIFTKLCELLQLLDNSSEAGEYLTFIKTERENIIRNIKETIRKYEEERISIKEQYIRLIFYRDDLPFFEFKKKAAMDRQIYELQRRLNELERLIEEAEKASDIV